MKLTARLRSPKTIVLADQMLASGQNFGIVVFCARALSLADFAVLAFALIGILVASSFQQGLVATPAMTLQSLLGEEDAVQYGKGLYLLHIVTATGLGAAFAVFMLSAGHFGQGPDTAAHAWPATFYLVARLHQEFCRRFHIGRARQHIALAADATLVAVTAIGFGAMLLAGQRSVGAAFVVLAIASLTCAWFPYRLLFARIEPARFRAVMRRHLASGAWFSLTSVCTILGGTMVQIISGSRLGPTALAALRACGNLTGFVGLILQSIENYLPQVSARALRHGTPDTLHRALVVRTTLQLAAVALPAAIVFALLAEPVMRLLYGAKFDGFGGAAALYMLVPVISGLALPAGIYLRTFELSRILFGMYLVSIVPVIPVSILLIDRFGIIGAIATMLLSQATYLGLVLAQSVRVRRREQGRMAVAL